MPNPASDDCGDTIQPVCEIKLIPTKIDKITIASQNPFATLKYAVEAVPFFDGQNIPLSYFIEECEEAKSMLPAEAESQFTKIIRTRIVGDARRTIQDQIFDCVAQLTCNGADFLRLLPGLPPAGQLGRCQGSERGRREIASLGYVLMLKCIVRFISLLFVLQGGIRCLTKRWRMSYVRRRSRFHVDRRSVIAWRWFLAVRRDLRITVR